MQSSGKGFGSARIEKQSFSTVALSNVTNFILSSLNAYDSIDFTSEGGCGCRYGLVSRIILLLYFPALAALSHHMSLLMKVQCNV